MNFTHNINRIEWKMFTLMIRDEHACWVSCAHLITDNEDDDIVAVFLKQVKIWCQRNWKLRYFLTDDFAVEQRAVSLTFQDLIVEEMKVDHFLCRKHFERTLDRKMTDNVCKVTKSHLYKTLYFRHSFIDCEKKIETAIRTASEIKRSYIKREWWNTRHQWVYYARQHSCFLLQNMTTNAMKFWHKSLKIHAKDKKSMSKFSLVDVVSHVLKIDDQWEQRARKEELLFRFIRTAECTKHSYLAMFSESVQTLLVDQMKKIL